jgi:hypothetical protein
MDEIDEVLFATFKRLREYLFSQYGVALSLRAHGQDLRLGVRGRANTGDEDQPHYSLVIAPRYGAYQLSYKPGGARPPEGKKTLLEAATAEEMFDIVRSVIETERKRLMEYRQRPPS